MKEIKLRVEYDHNKKTIIEEDLETDLIKLLKKHKYIFEGSGSNLITDKRDLTFYKKER